MRKLVGIALLCGSTGCAEVVDALGAKAPTGELSRVDLVQSPTATELAGWGCGELLDDASCALFGVDVPRRNDLLFSFDLVFDLTNRNDDLPIPLVETLLGFTAFETENLGSVCVSFCDPDDEACVPATDAEGACEVRDSEQVDEPEDLLPTVEDLVGLAETATTGDLDNGDWRLIGPNETVEAHLQFDLGIDPMLQLGDELLLQAAEDLLYGDGEVSLDVPYTVEGTLFFDVPELGREAIGFGPFDDVWTLR